VNAKTHHEHLRDLLYFPECGMASYVLQRRGAVEEVEPRVIMGPVRYAEIDYGSWTDWIHESSNICTVCGQAFATAQGMASHRHYVHGVRPVKPPDDGTHEADGNSAEPYGRHKNPVAHPELKDAKIARKECVDAIPARKRNPW
jgi:hypothetical protein